MYHTAEPECEMRLDRYLRSLYPNLQQSVIEKAVRKGLIRVNGNKCTSKVKVSGGEVIFIPDHISSLSQNLPERTYSKAAALLLQKIRRELLVHEDDHLLAIAKPSGLATQGGNNVKVSVDCALQHHKKESGQTFRLVHRLDSPTSGIMLIAKNRATATQLASAFKERLVNKLYLALTQKAPRQTSGLIKSPIDGREAATRYRLLKEVNGAYLLAFSPKTGRMHQVRRHASALGCPIVGDRQYGSLRHKHLMLHSAAISIPKNVNTLLKHRFKASLPLHWSNFLDSTES